MPQYLKRCWSPVLTVLTVLTVLATSSDAFAQLPGEDGFYTGENIQLAGITPSFRTLNTDTSYVEARNNGNVLRVWKGLTPNNQVWMAFGDRAPFTLGTTQTFVAPAVVPFGPNNFMVFHSGTDGGIYFTVVGPPISGGIPWSGSWMNISGQSTNQPVSAAQYSTACGCVFVVYRGAGNDLNAYGTWLDGNGWHFDGNIGGGQIFGSPSITYSPVNNTLFVVGIGTDNDLWVKLGAPKAITAAPHKLARIVFHMLTTGQAYDETVFAQQEVQNNQRMPHSAEILAQP